MNKKRIFIGILIITIAGGLYLYQNFNSIITRTTENIASESLGVNVNIGGMDISLANKQVIVTGINIDNPPGYSARHAITAETVTIGLNTVSKDFINFDEIRVKGSVVNLEVNQNGMNIIDLKNLANRKTPKESKAGETIRVIVKRMVIDASVIHPRITLIDKDLASITMPAIRLSNIGSGNGETAGDVITQVLTKYINAIHKRATQNGISITGFDRVEKTLNNAKDTIKGLFQ